MWQLEISKKAEASLNRLNEALQKQIMDDLHNQLMPIIENHNKIIKRASSPRSNFWPFRSGDFEILCRLHYSKNKVEVVLIAYMGEMPK